MGDFKQQNTKRVLDLGCGAGRHTVALANAGLHVTSLDVSETALGELRDRLDKSALTNVTLVKHDMAELPFLDDYFDALVRTNVLHHGTINVIRKTIGEIHRILKSGACGLIVTLSKRDFRCGDGEFLEADTYRFTEGDEKGITHHFFPETELKSVFGHFVIKSLVEELVPVERGNRAHYFLTIGKA